MEVFILYEQKRLDYVYGSGDGFGLLESKINNHLILALDITNIDRAIKVALMTSEYIDAIKIGLPLGLVASLDIIQRIKERTDLPIMADIKICDVPEIAKKLAHVCFDSGADAITIHGFAGPCAVEECVNVSGREKDVIVLTEITHPDAAIFMESVSEDIARMARDVGASGIQAPGTRPEKVSLFRSIVGDDMLIVSCGIGAQGGKIGGAIEAGADFEIFGRSITATLNPEESAREISRRLKEVAARKQ